jgi:5-(carboxyamino)imidazole ribonucleotide synthase
MVNLVGEEGFSGQVVYENIEKIIDGVTLTFTKKREKTFQKEYTL